MGFKSLLRQNNQVALFLRKPFQSNFALQQFFNLCFLLNYKSIIKGDFSVSFDFRRKNMRLGSCWPLKNRKLKKCCKGKTLVKCSANFKKNAFLRPIETAGKSRKCPAGALVSGGRPKTLSAFSKSFQKRFLLLSKRSVRKKQKFSVFFQVFLFSFLVDPHPQECPPLTLSHVTNCRLTAD